MNDILSFNINVKNHYAIFYITSNKQASDININTAMIKACVKQFKGQNFDRVNKLSYISINMLCPLLIFF